MTDIKFSTKPYYGHMMTVSSRASLVVGDWLDRLHINHCSSLLQASPLLGVPHGVKGQYSGVQRTHESRHIRGYEQSTLQI